MLPWSWLILINKSLLLIIEFTASGRILFLDQSPPPTTFPDLAVEIKKYSEINLAYKTFSNFLQQFAAALLTL